MSFNGEEYTAVGLVMIFISMVTIVSSFTNWDYSLPIIPILFGIAGVTLISYGGELYMKKEKGK